MQSKTSSRCTSALAVALVVMSAAALDTGFTNAADTEKFASIDSVIGGLNHGRRLQGETEKRSIHRLLLSLQETSIWKSVREKRHDTVGF